MSRLDARSVMVRNEADKLPLVRELDVSVVIPTYNSAGFLARTLESVALAAADLSFEIVVVDDKSADAKDLAALVSRTAHCRLIEKSIKTNAADSRNLGFLVCRGRYVQFLDSDDLLRANTLKSRIEALESTEADFLVSGFIEGGGARLALDFPATASWWATVARISLSLARMSDLPRCF